MKAVTHGPLTHWASRQRSGDARRIAWSPARDSNDHAGDRSRAVARWAPTSRRIPSKVGA